MKENKKALYHRIMRRENFEKAAKDLFQLLVLAQNKTPDTPRSLYVDIDGHRNESGGFDSDMLELQKEFGLGFLLPYFTEVHFPLITVKNTKPQRNDIPDKLEIYNADNRKDDSLNELYIENYSNTEFASEEDVCAYLQKVSVFLRKYCEMDVDYALMEREPYDPLGYLPMWRGYMKDLIVELFNLFLGGNLLSAAAMTRSLMDCYAHLSVLKREKDEKLLADWFVCSLFAEMKNWPEKERDKILPQVRQICEATGSDYAETVQRFVNGYQDAWLKKIFPTGKITFKRICDHLCEPEMSEDYREACAFVHGQSIVTKMIPFLTYASIYKRLYLMMIYMFKAIRLYPVSDELEEEMQELEAELLELGEAYLG